jgi:anion-transporting  ArsA/GET3 family ATPase
MNQYKITTVNGTVYTSRDNDFSKHEDWMGLPERTVEVDSEPYERDDILEEIPEVKEAKELVVERVEKDDELLETIPEVIEGDETKEPEKYRVLRQFVVEKAKVRLRAQYQIEIEDISQEIAAQEAKKLERVEAVRELKKVQQMVDAAKEVSNLADAKRQLEFQAIAIQRILKHLGII